jgi:hypothetical protein
VITNTCKSSAYFVCDECLHESRMPESACSVGSGEVAGWARLRGRLSLSTLLYSCIIDDSESFAKTG